MTITQNTKISIFQKTPSDLFRFKSINMPIYQRKYCWGGKGNEKKGFEYFENYLIQNSQNNYSGAFFGFTVNKVNISNANDLQDKQNEIEFYISDGQHRLTTIAISLLAINTYIKDLNSKNKHIHKDLAKTYKELEDIISKANQLNIVINDFAGKKLLYQEINEYHDSLKTNITDGFTKSLIKKPIQNTYHQILDFLRDSDKETSIQTDILNFFGRLTSNIISLTILQPAEFVADKKCFNEVMPESLKIFNQMNGLNKPLSEGELFKSFIIKNENITIENHKESSLYKYVAEGFDSDLLKKYKLKSNENVVDFIQKTESTDWIKKNIVWVSEKMIEERPENDLKKFGEYIKSIELIDNIYLNETDDSIRILWNIFTYEFLTPRILAFIVKFYQKKKNLNEEINTLLLIKLLIFLLIYRSRYDAITIPNLSRDINDIDDEETLLTKIYGHFMGFQPPSIITNNDNIENLKNSVVNHIANHPFGNKSWRKTGKLLLIIKDIENIKSGVHSKIDTVWNQYHYEHIYPQNWTKDSDIHLKNSIKGTNESDIVDRCNNLKSDLKSINSIGNGALLIGNTNSSLKNLSPYSKWQKLSNLNNSTKNDKFNLWDSHKDFLEKTNKTYEKLTIDTRAVEIAEFVGKWLLDDFKNKK
jgi:HPt (histidine-containing phosphotransfer) domain-containing protein